MFVTYTGCLAGEWTSHLHLQPGWRTSACEGQRTCKPQRQQVAYGDHRPAKPQATYTHGGRYLRHRHQPWHERETWPRRHPVPWWVYVYKYNTGELPYWILCSMKNNVNLKHISFICHQKILNLNDKTITFGSLSGWKNYKNN